MLQARIDVGRCRAHWYPRTDSTPPKGWRVHRHRTCKPAAPYYHHYKLLCAMYGAANVRRPPKGEWITAHWYVFWVRVGVRRRRNKC